MLNQTLQVNFIIVQGTLFNVTILIIPQFYLIHILYHLSIQLQRSFCEIIAYSF